MTKRTTRDFEADFEAAMVDEYEGYKRAGRDEDAAAVAKVLKDQYDHDVAPKTKPEPKPKADAPERADIESPEEKAVPSKPEHAAAHPPEAEQETKRGPGRPRKA